MAKPDKDRMETQEDMRWQIYKDVRRRIKQRYAERAEILSHGIAYVIGMIAIVVAVFFTDWVSGFWAVMAALVIVGWTMGFLIHLSQFVLSEMRERAISAELQRLGLLELADKRKNDAFSPARLVRLSDDGEIIALDEQHHTQNGYQDSR